MNEELLPQFLIEARELTELANLDLLALDAEGPDAARVDSAFRAIHTLKGSVGLFDLPALGAMLHVGEGLLERMRADEGAVDSAVLGPLLDMVAEADRWLDELSSAAAPSEAAIASAAAIAVRLGQEAGTTAAEAAAPANAEEAFEGAPVGAATCVRYRPDRDAYFRGDDPVALMRALPGLLELRVELAADVDLQDYQPFDCRLALTAFSSAAAEALRPALRLVADQIDIVVRASSRPERSSGEAAASRTLRIDADRLDALAGLVDDVVVVKNTLAHHLAHRQAGHQDERRLANSQTELDRAVGRLHAAVMDLRLTPLSQLFSRLPGQVRSIAQAVGRPARLHTVGGELALDKTVADGLYEPLMHLLRNAVDHGVETAEERRAAGKPETATITVSARAAGSDAVIEISDDGRGLDPERIRRVAVERGVATPAEAVALSDDKAAELIFAPGFSTARAVTAISGRGVGMDAVRAAIARLGGRIGIDNAPGEGLTIRLTLPLRVVLSRLAVVRAGDERYGVPLDDLREIARTPGEAVARVRDRRVVDLRGEALPLLGLGELVGQGPLSDRAAYIVLVAGDGPSRIGVAVDRLEERIEAPLRPLEGLLAGTPGVQGAVVQADGSILMVLDLVELAR